MAIAKIFPTIENNQPYEAGKSTPYFEVYTTNSVYSVSSSGFKSSWYVFQNETTTPTFSSNDLVFTGNSPIMRFYSGKSWPIFVAPEFHKGQQFGVHYESYFSAQSTFASLHFYGRGRVSCSYTKGPTTYNLIASQELGMTANTKLTGLMTGLTPDSFYYLTIKFWNLPKKTDTDNIFVCTWKDDVSLDRLPLTAGYFISPADFASHSGFIPATKLNKINSIEVSNGRNELSKFTFTIPVVSSTASLGYKYIKDKDYFQDVTDANKTIKKFRKIELHSGYKTATTTISTITKFTGQIRGWTVNRNTNGQDIAEIQCFDWRVFLQDTINTGIPNVSDYLSHDYVSKVEGGLDGSASPRTYDGWLFKDAVNNILINAYIDPKILYEKRKRISVDDEIVDGPYLNHDLNFTDQLRLDRNFNYGNVLSSVENVDDKYNWQFSIGDSLLDNLQKLMDSYGFRYGINNEGNFYTQSVQNPIKIKSTDDMSLTGFTTEVIDVKKLHAFSVESATSSNKVVATFVGAACKLILDFKSTYGTVDILMSNPTLGVVVTGSQNLSRTKEWHFFDGIDDNIGNNPCIIAIGTGLKYGSYSLNITNTSAGAATVSVNSLLIYDHDYDFPDFNLFTGNSGSQRGVIHSNMDVESTADNIRNDVIVLGRLKGVRTQLSTDPDDNQRLINPNNPVSDYVISRAIDRISLGSVSNSNYVGRPMQLMIVSPNILTDEKAEWLSLETAKRFNQFSKSLTPKFQIIGNPLMEIEDFVKSHDVKIGVVSTIHNNFWIKSVTESYSGNKHITNLDLEALEPWQSFFKYPTPSLKRVGYTVFSNVQTFNTGMHSFDKDEYCALDSFIGAGDSVSTITLAYNRINMPLLSGQATIMNIFPRQGFIKFKDEIIQYRKTKFKSQYLGGKPNPNYQGSINKIDFGDLTRGMYSTPTRDLNVLPNLVDVSISPYGTEMFGVTPAIQFELLFPGFVQVTVRSSEGNLLDSLTGQDVPNFDSNWDFLQPGTYFYSWGMTDRVGNHNEFHSSKRVRQGGTQDVPGIEIAALGTIENFTTARGDYTIGQGYYVQNLRTELYSKSLFYVRYRDLTQTHFSGEDSVSNARPIYSELRRWGSSLVEADKVREVIGATGSSQLIKTGTATLLYSSVLRQNIRTAFPSTMKRFYDGQENNGLGLRINLKNDELVKRLAKVKLTRYIGVFSEKLYSPVVNWVTGELQSPRTATNVIEVIEEVLIEGDSFNHVIDSTNGLDVYLKPPRTGFFTPETIKYITTNTSSILHKGTASWREETWYIAICHLHFLRLTLTDVSGYTEDIKFVLHWIPKEILNTEADHAATPKTNPYDGNAYDGMAFKVRGWQNTSSVDLKLPFKPGDVFLPFSYFKLSSFVKNYHLRGIVVFGKYK